MSRIQYDALSVKQFQRGNQNMYIGEKQKPQNDVFFLNAVTNPFFFLLVSHN